MAKSKKEGDKTLFKYQKTNVINKGGPTGWVYFLGMVASVIYFIQTSDGFWNIVLAFLKAVVWPVFVIHRALELLNI
ncbi:hypothetical protein A3D14_01840 [Candidatus Saccharibacteria bacterium RIFCSPHIGHO2_02_FULL_47_12]|nr:MAG: hypothetical protein A3D14_01840 [Candidatus Saccharibacteria bacterium RIFCSPHIGHO2_02_FULL_47_12]